MGLNLGVPGIDGKYMVVGSRFGLLAFTQGRHVPMYFYFKKKLNLLKLKIKKYYLF